MIGLVIKAEFRKYLLEMKTYYADHLVGMVMTLLIFSVFALSSQTNQASFYVGFVYWYLMSSLITESSTSLSMEKQLGTLEQLLIKPVPFSLLITIKAFVWYLVNAIKVLLVLVFLSLFLNISFHFHWLLVPVFLVASVGIFGFTLVLVALTLKYTKVASFESIISYLLLFLTGAVFPLEKLPRFIQGLGQSLPLTRGLSISRQILDSGHLAGSDFVHLLLQSLFYLVLGYGLFSWIYRQSKQSGIDRNY